MQINSHEARKGVTIKENQQKVEILVQTVNALFQLAILALDDGEILLSLRVVSREQSQLMEFLEKGIVRILRLSHAIDRRTLDQLLDFFR